uniref:Uncharacterized protein n=1 Tax=Candidatus Kentrum sp. TC TaxID=2126339 RepID=A0A451A1J2_9GAMM|nr:MAG: hypothetical protein BECKTC1821F_GA0114240_103825 [Candidatus Kentron sp. TC]
MKNTTYNPNTLTVADLLEMAETGTSIEITSSIKEEIEHRLGLIDYEGDTIYPLDEIGEEPDDVEEEGDSKWVQFSLPGISEKEGTFVRAHWLFEVPADKPTYWPQGKKDWNKVAHRVDY